MVAGKRKGIKEILGCELNFTLFYIAYFFKKRQ